MPFLSSSIGLFHYPGCKGNTEIFVWSMFLSDLKAKYLWTPKVTSIIFAKGGGGYFRGVGERGWGVRGCESVRTIGRNHSQSRLIATGQRRHWWMGLVRWGEATQSGDRAGLKPRGSSFKAHALPTELPGIPAKKWKGKKNLHKTNVTVELNRV